MAYKVDPAKCVACHTCVGVCPVMAISVGADQKAVIDPSKCISCGTCAAVCPVAAIAPDIPAAPKPAQPAPAEPASQPATATKPDEKPAQPAPAEPADKTTEAPKTAQPSDK